MHGLVMADPAASATIHYAGLFDVDEQYYDFKSIKRTGDVPAKLGQAFGIFFSIQQDQDPMPVKIHQVIKNPEVTETNTLYFADGGRDFLAFSFDDPEEIVEGDWVFELWYGDHLLASSRFNVAKEHEVPSLEHDGAVASVCKRVIQTNKIRRVKICTPPTP